MFARSRPGCAEGFLPGPQAASFGSRCSQLPPICRGLRAFVLRTRRPVPGTGREPGCAGRVPPSAPTRPPCSWLGEVAAPLCGVRELGVSVRDGSRAAAERGVPRPWQRFLLPLLAWARVLISSLLIGLIYKLGMKRVSCPFRFKGRVHFRALTLFPGSRVNASEGLAQTSNNPLSPLWSPRGQVKQLPP